MSKEVIESNVETNTTEEQKIEENVQIEEEESIAETEHLSAEKTTIATDEIFNEVINEEEQIEERKDEENIKDEQTTEIAEPEIEVEKVEALSANVEEEVEETTEIGETTQVEETTEIGQTVEIEETTGIGETGEATQIGETGEATQIEETGEATQIEETSEVPAETKEIAKETEEESVEISALSESRIPIDAVSESIKTEASAQIDETKEARLGFEELSAILKDDGESVKINELEKQLDEADKATIDESVQAETETILQGEKLLAEIDASKVREETEHDIEVFKGATVKDDVEYSWQQEDLPAIRGLAELEFEEEEAKESMGEYYPSKRQSIRASMALKLYEDAEENMMEKKQRIRRDLAQKGMKKDVTTEVPEIEEEKPPLLTREEYYVIHEKLTADFIYIRVKNKYLMRKMAEHFKKRKMEHALKEETEVSSETMEKYDKKLDKLAELLNNYTAETTRIGEEIDVLLKKKEEKFNEKQNIFNKSINREREIGTGLISTKTGKEIPQKDVEHLIRRKISAADQIANLRLKFIIKRDEFAEKNAELRSLDNIGEDLSLMDYEQLKIENRSLADKLEERDEELTKLRIKCRNAVQIMAHVREKSAALDADMDILKEEHEEVHSDYIEIRERLNFFKTERDEIRNKTTKLKAESGLLTKPKLLQDMETALGEAKIYEETLENVKNEYNHKTQQIRNLRKNIAVEVLLSRKIVKEKKTTTTRKYFQVRPSLHVPTLPDNFLDKLGRIIPKK